MQAVSLQSLSLLIVWLYMQKQMIFLQTPSVILDMNVNILFWCKFSKLYLVAEDITAMEILKSFSPGMIWDVVGAGDGWKIKQAIAKCRKSYLLYL